VHLKYIYFCWGGAHSSVTAAAIHLGNLPSDRVATVSEILQTQRFDLATDADMGRLFRMGCDEQGNEVFILGLGPGHKQIRYGIATCLELLGVAGSEYRLVNCLPCVNWAARIGGFTSRYLGVVSLGRPLVAWGVHKSYHNFIRLVQWVKSSDAQTSAFLDWSPPL